MVWRQVAIRLAVAALAGMLIGLERELHEKAAGFRTLTLVSAGSALFVLSAVEASPAEGVRMMAGVAAGVGFLGAGAILRIEGSVLGLTTAASVWISSALGVAAALGQFAIVLMGASLAVFVLALMAFVPFERFRKETRLYALTWGEGVRVSRALSGDMFEARGLGAQLAGVSKTDDRVVVTTWHVIGDCDAHQEAVKRLADEPQILTFEMHD